MEQAGRVLNLRDVIIEDQLGTWIAKKFVEWNMGRSVKMKEWEEVRNYLYATDTTKTTNSKLPWKNKTTIPKLCQIRDNLTANYYISNFPKRNWVHWEADDEDSNTLAKREAIEAFSKYMLAQNNFKSEMAKAILDYIDFGNCFVQIDWEDNRNITEDKLQVGYVGPTIHRINPLDVVFNPIATSFQNTPKIVRSLITLGEVKEMLTRLSTNETKEEYEALWDYLIRLRRSSAGTGSTPASGQELAFKDEFYQVDGFTSFKYYLESDYCEVLTFYGDMYDYETDEFLRNQVVMVVDRHKVISKKTNPSFFGYAPIFHCGWRPRQDNLWAMGPLDNLVGMQYRIDHIENLKADVWDLLTFPPLKIRGYVEDFEWGPFSRIYVGDRDSDVEIMAPPFQILTANQELQYLMQMMEEMAGSPKEAMGFRTPGEKTKYEVQRLENASARIYQHKIYQFAEQIVEPALNGMIELARRKLPAITTVPVFDDDFKMLTFLQLTPDDITGNGRIKPAAARHFAEKAELVQTLTQFFGSPIGQDPNVNMHFSGIGVGKLMESALDLQDTGLFKPYIKISEEAEATKLANVARQQVAMESTTPSGLRPDEVSPEVYNQGLNTLAQQTNSPGLGQEP